MIRRNLLKAAGAALSFLPATSLLASAGLQPDSPSAEKTPGDQRLSVRQLQEWESWKFGMFIHYGMSTFLGKELPVYAHDKYGLETYNPPKLDVGQWVSVARDAGMKYMILTAKHTAGHCLWPSKHTDFTVANSPDTTDVVGEFVKHCREKGLKVGIYYCCMDNYHTFGSLMPNTQLPDGQSVPWYGGGRIPKEGEVLPYVTSLYQNFLTAQIDELISDYGQIDQLFIDIPQILGPGYRTWLYERIARISPATLIEMNNGKGFDGKNYHPEEYFPQDIISYEIANRSETVTKWWHIDGRKYYMPGEVLERLGDTWFWEEGTRFRPVQEIVQMYGEITRSGLNYNLNVPPDKSGQINRNSIDALMKISKMI